MYPKVQYFEGLHKGITNKDGIKVSEYEQGITQYFSGDVYEGVFTDSKRNGKGKYQWKNGNLVVSEYINDVDHGPFIRYETSKAIKIGYYSNGDKIYLYE